MAVQHDIKCDHCEQVEENVLCRRGADKKAIIPPCPQCGRDRHWVPSRIAIPSTTRREAPRGMAEHYKPGPGGFAQKYSKEREADHVEARRKGDLGNQEEFADVVPLTPDEIKSYDAIHKDDP